MHLEDFPENCGIAVLCKFSPATKIEHIKEQCVEAKKQAHRFIIATLNQAQYNNLGPKLIKCGFKLSRKGINPIHDKTIYIYIKDLGLFKDRNKYRYF